jgi:Protein of unknown function (DUF2817)
MAIEGGCVSEFFSDKYSEARARFLATCGSRGAEMRSYRHEQLSEELGNDLAVDTARFGPANASRTLVLIAGTHGVEGFCGSACQIAAADGGCWNALPADMSVFLIYGLNPYGFAMLRRVDGENIDLNRNFVDDFNALATYNAEYDEINAALNPTRWQETDPQDGDEQIAAFIKTKGMKRFQEVVSIGQYRHSKGLFFGGTRKSWSRIILEKIIEREFQNTHSIGVIDYHTGLGPHGVGELISFGSEDSIEYKRSIEWFGPKVKSTKSEAANRTSVSADVGGPIDNGFQGSKGIVTFVSLEFGTVPIPAVLRALRAENWLQYYGQSDSALGRKIKEDLKAAFYPADQSWGNMVLGRSREVLEQAMAGLTNA